METRLDTFNGWQMTATVEGRPSAGKSRYYIVAPLAYKEFSAAAPIQPANFRYTAGSFETAEDAFEVAFSFCKRAIVATIKLRGTTSVKKSAPAQGQ